VIAFGRAAYDTDHFSTSFDFVLKAGILSAVMDGDKEFPRAEQYEANSDSTASHCQHDPQGV